MFVPDVISCITSFSDFPAMRNMMTVNQNWKTGVESFCECVTKFEVTYPDDTTFMALYHLGWDGSWNHFPNFKTIFTTQWQYFFMFPNLEFLCFRNLTEKKQESIKQVIRWHLEKNKIKKEYKQLVKSHPAPSQILLEFGEKFPLFPCLQEFQNLAWDFDADDSGIKSLLPFCPNIKNLVGVFEYSLFPYKNLEYFVGAVTGDGNNNPELFQNPNFKKAIFFCLDVPSEGRIKRVFKKPGRTLYIISQAKDDGTLKKLFEEEVSENPYLYEYCHFYPDSSHSGEFYIKCIAINRTNNVLFFKTRFWNFYKKEVPFAEQELLLLKISFYINNKRPQIELWRLYQQVGGRDKDAKYWLKKSIQNGYNPPVEEKLKTTFTKFKEWFSKKFAISS